MLLAVAYVAVGFLVGSWKAGLPRSDCQVLQREEVEARGPEPAPCVCPPATAHAESESLVVAGLRAEVAQLQSEVDTLRLRRVDSAARLDCPPCQQADQAEHAQQAKCPPCPVCGPGKAIVNLGAGQAPPPPPPPPLQLTDPTDFMRRFPRAAGQPTRICLVTSAFAGPTLNGGIATAFYSMARHLAAELDPATKNPLFRVTVLYVAHPYYGVGTADQV